MVISSLSQSKSTEVIDRFNSTGTLNGRLSHPFGRYKVNKGSMIVFSSHELSDPPVLMIPILSVGELAWTNFKELSRMAHNEPLVIIKFFNATILY